MLSRISSAMALFFRPRAAHQTGTASASASPRRTAASVFGEGWGRAICAGYAVAWEKRSAKVSG